MPTVNIIINQVGALPGEPGVSRDDLVSGSLITLTNDEPGNIGVNTWKWELISWPKLTPTQAAPDLINSTTSICTFTPYVVGTYIIQLVINDIIKGRIGAAIKTTKLHKRLPGEIEGNEYPGGWSYNLIDFLRTLEINSGGGGGATSLCALTDVDCSGVVDGEVLKYNTYTGLWEPGPAGGGTMCSLTDVDCSEVVDGSVLKYDDGLAAWKASDTNKTFSAFFFFGNGTASEIVPDMAPTPMLRHNNVSGGGSSTLCSLTDVDCTGALDGDALVYDTYTGLWGPVSLGSGSLCSLSDVDCSGANTGDVLTYNEYGLWIPSPGGSGSLDRTLIFSDDTEFTETGTSYSTKKTFRLVIDSDKDVTQWRCVFSAWATGGGTMSCYASVGSDYYEWTGISASSEGVIHGDITVTAATDTLLTVLIRIKADAGGTTAHIRYTDIYAVY